MESSTLNKEKIYDPVRSLWVVATPEEKVRQRLLKKMIEELIYPKELLVVEKSLSELAFGASSTLPIRRIDVVCFAHKIRWQQSLSPLLVIECKESKADSMKALEQVKGYNRFLNAAFIGVAHPEGELVGFWNRGSFCLLDHLPPYRQLQQAVSHAG